MAQLQETTVDGNVFVTGEVIETGNAPVSGTIDLASSDELPEGSSNLYFTTERAQDAAAQMLTAGVSPGTGITGTYSDNIDEFEFSVDLSPFSTDDLSEGSNNLYYSNAKVDTLFTAGSGLSKTYNGTTLTIDHDVSAAPSSNNSGSDYIQNITLDANGHVTNISSDTVPEFTFSIGEDTTSLFTVEAGHAITINEVSNSSLSVVGSEPTMFGGSIKQFEIDHNVSAASSVTNSGSDYIQGITLDPNGHVTNITSGTVSSYSFSVGLDTTSLNTVDSGEAVIIKEASGSSLSVSFSNPQPPLNQFEVNHNVSSASDTNNSGSSFVQNITFDANGHVTGVTSGTTQNISSTDDLSEGSTNLYSQWLENGSSIYYSGGNVGVLTNNPNTALEVNGDITTTDGVIGSMAVRDLTVSTSTPSGGNDGDVWYQVSP